MINNDFFFSEVKIVANHAIRYGNSIDNGVEQGIKYLRQKRYSDDPVKFTDKNFDRYATAYAELARSMVKKYLEMQDE